MTGNFQRSWQERLRRTPLWVITLGMAAVWSGIFLGIELLKGEDLGAAEIAITGAVGLVVATVIVWFDRWREAKDRKLPPGSATARNLNGAVATGKLPENAIAEEWVPGLRKIIRQDRHMVWVGPLVFSLLTALGIFLIFERTENPWLAIVYTALFISAAVWTPIWVRRRRMRIEQLIAQFSKEESATCERG